MIFYLFVRHQYFNILIYTNERHLELSLPNWLSSLYFFFALPLLGTLILDCSTIDPITSKNLHLTAKSSSVQFVDCPVRYTRFSCHGINVGINVDFIFMRMSRIFVYSILWHFLSIYLIFLKHYVFYNLIFFCYRILEVSNGLDIPFPFILTSYFTLLLWHHIFILLLSYFDITLFPCCFGPSGGVAGATAGTLTFMVGASGLNFEETKVTEICINFLDN